VTGYLDLATGVVWRDPRPVRDPILSALWDTLWLDRATPGENWTLEPQEDQDYARGLLPLAMVWLLAFSRSRSCVPDLGLKGPSCSRIKAFILGVSRFFCPDLEGHGALIFKTRVFKCQDKAWNPLADPKKAAQREAKKKVERGCRSRRSPSLRSLRPTRRGVGPVGPIRWLWYLLSCSSLRGCGLALFLPT
jgi:hypothetical protein